MAEITKLWIPFEVHRSKSEEENMETVHSFFIRIEKLSRKGWEIVKSNPVTEDEYGNVLLFELYFEKTGEETKGCDCDI